MVGLTAIALGPLAESALMPWSQRWRAARSSSPSTDLEAVVPVVRKPAEARPGRWLLAHDEVHEPWSLETHRAVATHTRRQVPEALWLTRWEAAWNVISALLPLAYLWSLPLLARAGFCQGPAQWRWGPEASISRYINNPWATAALGGACFFAAMDMWRFGGVGLKAEGYLPGSHPLEFGASRLALFCVQLSLGAMLVLSDAWHPALLLVAHRLLLRLRPRLQRPRCPRQPRRVRQGVQHKPRHWLHRRRAHDRLRHRDVAHRRPPVARLAVA